MIYLCRFSGDLLPAIQGAVSPKQAADLAAERTGIRPIAVIECPDALVSCEVRFAGPDVAPGEEEDMANSADYAELGVTLEPFEEFAEWLEAVDSMALDMAPETAPTEAPPPDDHGECDGSL